MKITSATFTKGIRGSDEIMTDGKPQIAFIGRSNVGKSSLINALTNRQDLVKVGKKPGKTTEINFFNINRGQYYFVDLPGYGYAKVNPEEKEKIRKLIFWYLTTPEVKPLAVVLVIDSVVGLTDFDLDTLQLLREQDHNYLIAANKIDKLNQKEFSQQIEKIKLDSLTAEIFPVSTKTKKGIETLSAKFPQL